MGDPGAVEAVGGLAHLVVAHLGERLLVDVRIPARGDEGRHAADRVRPAPMAGLHQQLGVGAHERDGHRDLGAVGEDHVGPRPELLDDAEDVVPAPGIEAGGVVAQLEEDLVHLERGEDRLDEHRRADRSLRDAQRLLRGHEDPVPQRRLEVALELRQVQVRARAAVEQLARVVEEPDPEVEDRGADRRAVDLHMGLRQVPATRPDAQGRDLVVEGVRLLIGLEGEAPANGLAHGPVAGHHVRPGGRERVLEVAHEDRCAAVERVDHHLRLGRAGDLDAPVVEVRRRGGDAPVGVAALDRVRQEVRRLAGVQALLPPRAVLEQLHALGIEGPMQLRHEVERLGRQHLLEVIGVARDHDAGREDFIADCPTCGSHPSGVTSPVRRS